MSRARSVYWNPEGTRYGIPTYPWRCAPAGLATRRQLAAAGLRPGGQPVAAQVMWHSTRCPSQHDVAYLYRLDLARPKRVPTAGQLAALGKALKARRTCPKCGRDAGYVIPARPGMCNACAEWKRHGERVDAYGACWQRDSAHAIRSMPGPAGPDNPDWDTDGDGRPAPHVMRVGPSDYTDPGRWWL